MASRSGTPADPPDRPFHSAAYGISLQSDRPLPGLRPLTAFRDPDLRIRLGPAPSWTAEFEGTRWDIRYEGPRGKGRGRPAVRMESSSDGTWFRLRYSEGTEFLLDRRGERILGSWLPGESLEGAAVYLLGPVLGLCLRFRGVTCLHASVVEVNGRAVVLTGPPGTGKSTAAAHFLKEGFPPLADDLAALTLREGALLLHRGPPRLRLWTDSVRAVFGKGEELPRLIDRSRAWPLWDKRCLDLEEDGGGPAKTPLPIAAVYCLEGPAGGKERPAIERLSPRAALVALAANLYPGYPAERESSSRDFFLLARLAEGTPVKRLLPPGGAERMALLRDAVLEDLGVPAPAGRIS